MHVNVSLMTAIAITLHSGLRLLQGPRSKFSSGGAKEECVKENFFRAGGGGACLWISIQFL